MWSKPFADTTYLSIIGKPVVTDGGPGPQIWLDGTTKTTTGVTAYASDSFTGYGHILAFLDWRANLLAGPSPV